MVACLVDVATEQEDITLLPAHRPTGYSKRRSLKFLQQDETSSESVSVEPPRHEVVICVDSTISKTNHSGIENPCENTPPKIPPTDFFDDTEEDTMPYPYPHYNDKVHIEAHIRAYLTTWQANHASERLAVTKANFSKITEFGLSLDG